MLLDILLFEIAGQRYGLRVQHVSEVLPAVTLLPAPGSSGLLEGILNLRGQAVPVVDVRAVLQLPRKPIEHTEFLIVVNGESRTLALRADAVLQIAVVAEGDVDGIGAEITDVTCLTEAARTGDGSLVLLLDPRQLSSGASYVEPTEMGVPAALEEPE